MATQRLFRSALIALTAATVVTALPSTRAAEFNGSGMWESSIADHSFASAQSWFSAGPAWLMRAMPGAYSTRSRGSLLMLESASEAIAYQAAWVGTLRDQDMSVFSYMMPFSASRTSTSVFTAPLAPTPPDYYWDTNGATPGTGGAGTWDLGTANWNEVTGSTAPAVWADGNIAHFAGTPGVVSVNGTFAPTSASFEITGYTLQTTNATDTVNGPIVLGPAVNLFINNVTTNANRTLEIGGNISGGVGSGITIQGAQTGSAHSRIVLTVANSVISVPITIAKTGAGPGGVVGNAAGQQITGSITNNSLGATLLGAGSGGSLTVSGPITGTAGLRLSSAASGASGAGTVTLTGNNTFSGATVVSTAASGLAILASTTGQALGGTSSVAVNSGTLRWGASDQINNTAGVTLNGGTIALNGFSEGAPGTNGVGALTLTANSTIDFAAGVTSSIIQFGGLGTHTAGTDLLITNWNGNVAGGGPERLLFSGNESEFQALYTQNDVFFNGIAGYDTVQFSGYYELVPIPEPSTWIGAALALAAIGWMSRKSRRAKSATSPT